MKNFETTITIQASREQVWQTLMNFQEYPKWNPFIKRITGNPATTEKLEVTMKLGDRKPMVFKPTVMKSKARSEFRWLGTMFLKGLFDGEHYFKLQKSGDNETTLTHGENFRGILSGLMLRWIGKETEHSFNKMNEALKNEVESKL